ncbi:putative HNH endonuclease [Tsukamurella phage TPA2]|uniref:putative HNH endonuclease n=1 Tax=Tsukamurella phage TPA2 TaxID=981330 RepID=UPI0001FF8D98|nr:putative HNH endonuclease [Tsukamurella phage TPA2]ADX31915.1 putative HNH endonuclease [Tsukamurella phage TPA2]
MAGRFGLGPYDSEPDEDDDVIPLFAPPVESTVDADRAQVLVARGSWCAPADAYLVDLPPVVVRPRPTELPVVECRRGLIDLMETLGWTLPSNAEASLTRFATEGGLDSTAMGWLAAVAHSRSEVPDDSKFRYFCGCCWRAIRGEL